MIEAFSPAIHRQHCEHVTSYQVYTPGSYSQTSLNEVIPLDANRLPEVRQFGILLNILTFTSAPRRTYQR